MTMTARVEDTEEEKRATRTLTSSDVNALSDDPQADPETKNVQRLPSG